MMEASVAVEDTKKEELDPVFDASAHNIVPLIDVLEGNFDAIGKMKLEFEKRGWCVIRLPTKPQSFWFPFNLFYTPIEYQKLLVSNFDPEILHEFFRQPNRIRCENFDSIAHKDTIHLLTPAAEPTLLYESHRPNLKAKALVLDWSQVLDKLALELVAQIAIPIFGCTKDELHRKAFLPVSMNGHRGMLDIVNYHNSKSAKLSPPVGHTTKEVNCVPHFDPGLLAISFFSSHDGLQLQDPDTKAWFAGPVNTRPGEEELGVIWLGAAAEIASGKKLKTGVHRVVYPQVATPRVTAWYELCTIQQANDDIKQNFPDLETVQPRNIVDAKPFTFLGGLSKLAKQRSMEEHYGLPSSKPLYDPHYKRAKDDNNPLFVSSTPQKSSWW